MKLRRDNSVLDSDLRIAAVSTRPVAIEEIDSEEARQTRLKKKQETLGVDKTMEIQESHASGSSGARISTDQIPPPSETSIAQSSTPDLVLRSDEPGGVLEPAQEERKARGESVPIGPKQATHELRHTSFRNWCRYCVRARAADTDNHTKNQSSRSFWPTAASCRMHQAKSCSQSWICWTSLSA